MEIRYKGQPNTRMDRLLEDALRCFKYGFIGSGYNFKTDERDLQFKILNRLEENEINKKK